MYRGTSNRLVRDYYQFSRPKSFKARVKAFSSELKTVEKGNVTDPYYRVIEESGHKKRGRSKHLGIDVQGPRRGDKSYNDPNRGLPVYAYIKDTISLNAINNARPYDKPAGKSMSSLGLPTSGKATLTGGKIYLQHWKPTSDHAYGGLIGISCFYKYDAGGSTKEFTLFIEYLHLITETYLPKNKDGKVIGLQEWKDTGRGMGFGPDMKHNKEVDTAFFASHPLIGYLGATQFPHVHIQCGFFNEKTTKKKVQIRIDPLVAIE